MRRLKGIKTRKSVAKRFKIAATGDVLFHGADAAYFKAKAQSRVARCAKRHGSDQPTFAASPRTSRSAIERS